MAAATTPAVAPWAITVATPPALAISAATTFERMPPDPQEEPLPPTSSSSSRRWSLTSDTSSAPARRGSRVKRPS